MCKNCGTYSHMYCTRRARASFLSVKSFKSARPKEKRERESEEDSHVNREIIAGATSLIDT